jgi:tRNA(fMet)-specific endonuclease VapC
MSAYMLDSGTCVGILKRDDGLLKRLAAVPVADVCISAITHSELMFGVATSRREKEDQKVLDLFLKYVAVKEYPRGAAMHYGEVRQGLELLERMVGANDLLIAAHARFLGLTLVTDKAWKLGRTPGLRVEDWTQRA